MSTNRIIAIGDIHGCAKALRAVVDAVSPTSNDTIITLGDYVDRGPDSKGVIDQLIQLRQHCNLVTLLGNHELMMMMAAREERNDYQFWVQFGGQETLTSYGCDLESIPHEHFDFISHCRPFFETDTHFFVHANYEPHIPLDRQPVHALFWQHLDEPPPPHVSGKIATVGHTPQPDGEVLSLDHLQCIDTYCFGGMWLTALDVESGKTWQADIEGKLRTPDSA